MPIFNKKKKSRKTIKKLQEKKEISFGSLNSQHEEDDTKVSGYFFYLYSHSKKCKCSNKCHEQRGMEITLQGYSERKSFFYKNIFLCTMKKKS